MDETVSEGVVKMIIKDLVENTSAIDGLKCEHGLSLYIETKRHKVLFDTGASKLFAENAARMGVNLAAVDTMILSHGHYDHGGGINTFLAINDRAKIYIHRDALGEHYADRGEAGIKYIGIDKDLEKNERIIFVKDSLVLDDELELFAGVKGTRFRPSGNKALLMKTDEGYKVDDFTHEQNLIISEDGKYLLVAGCAHNGIVNILDRFHQLKNRMPDYCIGGFHLHNPAADKYEDPAIVAEIAKVLKETGTSYYTGHCTGIKSYERLKEVMGSKVNYLGTGEELEL